MNCTTCEKQEKLSHEKSLVCKEVDASRCCVIHTFHSLLFFWPPRCKSKGVHSCKVSTCKVGFSLFLRVWWIGGEGIKSRWHSDSPSLDIKCKAGIQGRPVDISAFWTQAHWNVNWVHCLYPYNPRSKQNVQFHNNKSSISWGLWDQVSVTWLLITFQSLSVKAYQYTFIYGQQSNFIELILACFSKAWSLGEGSKGLPQFGWNFCYLNIVG